MKSALSDFILGKKGIYGILHIIILLMSLFLVISISIDTFKGIPFYTQSSYMKIQLWICIWFLFDFVLEFFLAKHKWRYIRTHFIFLLVAIPYQNIIAYYGWTFSPEVTYLLRFMLNDFPYYTSYKAIVNRFFANIEVFFRATSI